MLAHRSSKPVIAALAAVAVPVPLHFVAHHPARAAHRTPHHPVGQAPATRKRSGPIPSAPAAAPGTGPAAAAGPRDVGARAHRPKQLAGRRGLRLQISFASPSPVAHVAGDPSDTISDYQFAPATLSVHVGDTVTWTNDGPSEHSATAHGGSFNTGLLKKGASASHTFTQAGTFTYYCEIHPFMHGTIVVAANAASSNPTSSSGSSGSTGSGASSSGSGASSTASTAAPTASGQTLPNTGLDVAAPLLGGIALFGLGLSLRRRSRAGGSPS